MTSTFTPIAISIATSTPTAVPPAPITVCSTGAFFVRFFVSYDLPGGRSLESGRALVALAHKQAADIDGTWGGR